MSDVTATFDDEEGEILLTFSEDLYVFDDIYALTIELAEKLKAQLDAALREAKEPHGTLFRNRKSLDAEVSGRSTEVKKSGSARPRRQARDVRPNWVTRMLIRHHVGGGAAVNMELPQ